MVDPQKAPLMLDFQGKGSTADYSLVPDSADSVCCLVGKALSESDLSVANCMANKLVEKLELQVNHRGSQIRTMEMVFSLAVLTK